MSLIYATALAATLSAGVQTDAPSSSDLDRVRRAIAGSTGKFEWRMIEPDFRVQVDVRSPLPGEAVSPFNPVVRVPGGLYAFEQRQQLGNAWAGEPLVKIDVLPILGQVLDSLRAAQRGRRLEAARDQVSSELAALCSSNACERSAP